MFFLNFKLTLQQLITFSKRGSQITVLLDQLTQILTKKKKVFSLLLCSI